MPRTGTILLVEDDPDRRAAHEALLHRAGYDVSATGNGLRAVELACARPPAVALVDLLLPGQSGFRVTLDLKARFGDRVMVVLMSGTASAAHRDYAAATGADGYLTKPFTDDVLLEVVAVLGEPTPRAARPRAKIGA